MNLKVDTEISILDRRNGRCSLRIIMITEDTMHRARAAKDKSTPYSELISPDLLDFSNDILESMRKHSNPVHFTSGKIQARNKKNLGLP